MPNWCNNGVRLVAPNKELMDGLIASLEGNGEEKFFNYLRPRPESESENWYEWNIRNWGTKWDATPDSVNRDDDVTVDLFFESAWSPPIDLYRYLTEQGWTVTAKYHEPGAGYVGQFADEEEQDWEYNLNDESDLENIPEDLVEWANLREEYEDWKEMNDEDNEQD